MACDGVFEYIGLIPTTEYLKDTGLLNKFGYIEVDEKMHTHKEGVYAAGDCVTKNLRQGDHRLRGRSHRSSGGRPLRTEFRGLIILPADTPVGPAGGIYTEKGREDYVKRGKQRGI